MRTAVLAVLIVSAAAASPAWADDSGWYVGAALGQSHYSGGTLDVSAPAGWNVSRSDTATAYRLAGGYRFDAYWSAEAFYADLGRVTLDASNPHPILIPDVGTAYQDRVDAKGLGIEGEGRYPFNEQWAVYARLGAFDGRVHFQAESNGFVSPVDVSATQWRASYGIGVEWDFNPRWSATLGWDQFHQLGDSSTTGEYNVNLLAAAIVYRIF